MIRKLPTYDFAWEQVNNFTPEKIENFVYFIDRYRVS